MKSFYRLFPGDFVAGLMSLFFVLVLAADVSEAQFFNSGLAGTSPRTRMGCYPCSTLGTDFLNVEELGQHTYKFGLSEENGIVYTCGGGHIDIAHLRKAADWTAYIAAITYEELKKGETVFSFKLMEPSLYHVEVTYPENWKDLPEQQKENIIFDTSIRLGEYFVYSATTWHEILTWFGYKCTGFLYSEFNSAFTWEDTFSNLLGTYIAGQALRDTEHEYDEAMTLALAGELQGLGVQSSRTAKRASKKVKGQWFSSNLMLFIGMKKRHFDIGLKDGCVTPAIVPSVAGCEGVEPLPYPVPSLDFLSEYGFRVKLEIEPREMEKGKILRIVYLDKAEDKERIEPAVHFAVIMESIKEEAIEKYGSNVDLCEAKPWRLAKASEPQRTTNNELRTTNNEPFVRITEVADSITEETVEKVPDDVVMRDTPPQPPVEAEEIIEGAETDNVVADTEDDVIEDVAEEVGNDIREHEKPPQQLDEAGETIESAEPNKNIAEAEDDVAEDIAEEISNDEELPETLPQPLAEAEEIIENVESDVAVAEADDDVAEDVIEEISDNVQEHETPAQQPVEVEENTGSAEQDIPFVEAKIDVTEDVAEEISNDEELPETLPQPLAEAEEVMENSEQDVAIADVEGDAGENETIRNVDDVDLHETPPQQLVKPVNSPIKIYDFGFKVSRTYLGSVGNNPKVAFRLVGDNASGTDELTFRANKRLETAPELRQGLRLGENEKTLVSVPFDFAEKD